MSTLSCSFCERSLDEVGFLVAANRGTTICLNCAQRCVEFCTAKDSFPVTRFPRTPATVAAAPVSDTRHLDAFLSRARLWVTGNMFLDNATWAAAFLDVYEGAVLDTVRAGRPDEDNLVRANRIAQAFDAMMEAYRGHPHRNYLGAVFHKILSRSIREGFAYHVDTTVLVPAEGVA